MVKNSENSWTERWMKTALIQGAIIFILSFFLIVSNVGILKPEVSRVIASGGAGTWVLFGLIMYIILAGIATAVTSYLYFYIEHVKKIKIGKLENKLAWIHLIFSNIGAFIAFMLMIYGGYKGGAAMLPKEVGGLGQSAYQVHQEILGPLVLPILISLLILSIGVLAGGLSIVLSLRKK